MINKPRYKIARRLGANIFDKTQGQKFADREARRKVEKRSHPKSDFGLQMLEKQKANLDAQKKAKNALLAQTKNDEKTYQNLLSQALAEKAAIERALVSGVKVGPVKRGDPIGLVGNSGYPGCSTGKHLHFEIRKNNTWIDPAPYLQNKSVKDEQNGGNMALIVAGWEAADTKRAGVVLKNWDDATVKAKLAGKSSVSIRGTTQELTGITVE